MAEEQQILRRAQAGDTAAMRALYELYKQRIYRYLYYRLGNAEDAEDLTAEVFVRVIQALPTYRLQGDSAQAWIFQIARNLSIDQLRQRGRRPQTELDEGMEDGEATPHAIAEYADELAQLDAALQHLTEDQREVISLRFLGELPIAAVAQALGKTESAVKNLQLRGLKTLNKLLVISELIDE